MNSRHQQFYKSRGNFRRRGPDGEFFGFEKHANTFAPLANNQHSRPFRGRYPPRGGSDARGGRFQRGRGGGSKPSPSGQPIHQGQQQNQNAPLWNKITIIDGRRFDRSFILKELASYVQGHLKPILYKPLETGDVQFLIEDNDVAQAIRAASRRIVAPNGQKIIINVSRCTAPVVRLSPADVVVLKTVLEQRYDALDKSINLSSFTEDPTVRDHGVYLALSRNNVMLTVVSLIGEACSTLKAVDLSKNRLRFLDFFANLTTLCPDVSRLFLTHNMIDNLLELEKLADWKDTLVELSLTGNPLCHRIRNDAYTTSIRKIFPKLQRLDGKELSPAFKTGIEDELSTVSAAKMPPIKGNFFVNDDYKGICTRFIEEYFTIFDSTDKQKREQLFQAYDDDAVFTMTAHNLTEESNRIRSSCWNDFIRDSHNIKHASVWERYRSKLVHKGRLPILSYFCKDFPVVQHDPSSFIIDISFATDSLICLNVSGLYRLASHTSSLGSTRFFTRIFLLIPKNNGLAIVNEQLFSTTMTSEMQDRFRHNYSLSDGSKITPVAPDGSNQVIMSTTSDHHESPQLMKPGPAAPTGVVVIPATPTAEQSLAMLDSITDVNQKRHAMTELFSKESNMKEEWAKKCLEDCDWDFQKAAFTFTELNKSGSIPREAFK